LYLPNGNTYIRQNHCSMCKSDGAMPFSLSCPKVIYDSESAKILY